MSPDEESQEADCEDCKDHRAIAEDWLAGESRKHMRSQSHTRQDCYINFWMAEEPEEVLPQDGRASRMWLYHVLDVQPCWHEETRSGIPIKKQKHAASEQDRKRKKRK